MEELHFTNTPIDEKYKVEPLIEDAFTNLLKQCSAGTHIILQNVNTNRKLIWEVEGEVESNCTRLFKAVNNLGVRMRKVEKWGAIIDAQQQMIAQLQQITNQQQQFLSQIEPQLNDLLSHRNVIPSLEQRIKTLEQKNLDKRIDLLIKQHARLKQELNQKVDILYPEKPEPEKPE